jgi:BTB And C-terminal Kelch
LYVIIITTLCFHNVFQVIERQTERIIKDSAFSELPTDDILKLVSRNGLKIDEYELYEAIVKWATVRAKHENVDITPSNLRTIIGPRILKNVRFMTMTSAEFSRVYMGFKILSYDEILPIIFNINDKGSVPLPETISSSTEYRRQSISESILSFKAFNSCNLPNSESDNSDYVAHFSPKGIVKTGGKSILVKKLQIPMSIESIQSCCSLKEKFDILVFNNEGLNILRKSFNGYPTCNARGAEEMLTCNGTVNGGEDLIDVPVDEITLWDGYSMQVEFHNDIREYPKLSPLMQSISECEPRFVNEYGYNRRGYNDIRDTATERKCSVNEFLLLTYY